MNKIKKIGIITLNGYYNFGNRLQNYALTKILENKGYDVDTIWSGEEINFKSFIQLLIIILFPYNKKWFRQRKFYLFTKKNIKRVNYSNKVIKKYDAFIAGSDQVWNYESVKNNINYLIPFSNNQKLISFSASLGNSDMPLEYVNLYNKYISRFDSISVREESGKDILKNIVNINKSVEVVLDPTLLLDEKQWMKVEKKPLKMISQKYILCYFLGNLDDEYMNAILEFSKKHNYCIINILDKNDDFYCSGPEEFLYLVHNAELICTDSFHSSVFSFLYNRPFVVFKRKGEYEKMYSRIENLLRKFELHNREYNGKFISKENQTTDYQKAYELLTIERGKALSFLDESLKD